MADKSITMLGVGDVWINRREPESAFALVAPVLRSADVVVGNGEAIYTRRGINTYSMVENQPCDPSNMSGLSFANFSVITLAQNHIFDWGAPGVEDTANGLRAIGIAVVGAGMNIDEARKPAIIERKGTRFGFLAYNCSGPKESWATPQKPGCAYVNILTHYEPSAPSPGIPSSIYTFAEPSSLQAMVADICRLRPLCDILTVSFHKGLVHTPITIQSYDQEVSYAAIDAGADLVLGHHAHILKGIEVYQGKVIFHGLCNFVFDWELAKEPSYAAQQWMQKRKKIYGFEPDPEYPSYPFHPEAKQTIIARCIIENGKISRVSYLPCLINKQGQPEILKHDGRGQQVFDYVDKITRGADLNAQYAWKGDEVVIKAD